MNVGLGAYLVINWQSLELETKLGNILHVMLCILKALFVTSLPVCS